MLMRVVHASSAIEVIARRTALSCRAVTENRAFQHPTHAPARSTQQTPTGWGGGSVRAEAAGVQPPTPRGGPT